MSDNHPRIGQGCLVPTDAEVIMRDQGIRRRKRAWQVVAFALCSVWALSLAAPLEDELPGVHTAQDTRRAVLSDCDADCGPVCPAHLSSCPAGGRDTSAEAPSVADGQSIATPSGAHLGEDGMPHPLESGKVTTTILRL